MSAFFASVFGNELGTVIMSIVPMIELKGGIIFARSVSIPPVPAFLLAFSGSTIVFIVFFFLLRPLLNLLKKIKFIGRFAEKLEEFFQYRAERTLEKRQAKNKEGFSETALKMFGVFIFVTIPLPMTGVWAGTALAVFLNLNFKDALVSVFLGNFVAGIIISILAEVCLVVSGTTVVLDYVLWGLFALAVVLLVVAVILVTRHKSKGGK